MKFNHIISLGSDCLPRLTLTKYLIKKSKKEGELSCPFDLSVTNVNDLIKLLENNFKDFMNSEYFYMKKFDNIEVISHKIYTNTHFNHESPFMTNENFIENDYQKLKERYNERIKNFYKYINDDNILFVYNVRDNININDLLNCLSNTFPNLSYKLCVIHLYKNIICNIDLTNDHVIYIPYFMKDIWNKDEEQLDFVTKLVGKAVEYNLENDNEFPI